MKISDIASEISVRESNPSESQYKIFVGLEHYDSGNTIIERYGDASKINSAAKIFSKGDILVARRNVYLRRASVVTFDGLTSGDSIVLRSNNESYRDLLPFILNSDDFWDYAEKNADGTMSKRLSPKKILDYEFNLSDDPIQLAQYAKLLWKIDSLEHKYRRLIDQCDELIKAQFVEMFGDPVINSKGFKKIELGNRCEIITGNTPSRAEPENYGSYIEWIKSDNITTYTYLTTAKESLSKTGFKKCRYVNAGSLLMTCIAGGINSIGNVAITNRPVAFNQQINAITPIEDDIIYLYWLMIMSKSLIHSVINSTLKCIISKGQLSRIKFPFSPIQDQKEFAAFVQQVNQSKESLQATLSSLQAIKKSILQSVFV
ncbi:restriction endonuclease subunit S [Mailhella sp.]